MSMRHRKYSGEKPQSNAFEKAERELPETAVVITLGKRGAVYSDSGKKVYQAAYEVKAADTTAAGDTFTGYFAAGLYRQEPIDKILKQAAAAAGNFRIAEPGLLPQYRCLPRYADFCPQ